MRALKAVETVQKTGPPQGSHRPFGPSDLFRMFRSVARSWGVENFEILNACWLCGADLPMERMVILSGTLRGFAILRADRGFPAFLRERREGRTPMAYGEAETFEELLSLFALFLFHDQWTREDFTIGPLRPFRSIPQDWPTGPPTAVCGMMVEGFPVEVRVWLED